MALNQQNDPVHRHPHDDYWTEFDHTDTVLVTMGLDALDPAKLTPESRSRLIELRSIFIQRLTGYYGE